jgi:hypothetical protein
MSGWIVKGRIPVTIRTPMAKTEKANRVTGFRINAPGEFCPVLGAHSHSIAVWTRLRGAREQTLRHALDELFRDLPFVDALDAESVSDFLDVTAIPLSSLHQMGLQLFVISAKGTNASPPIAQQARKRIADWRHNSYIVAPDPAFYWLEPAEPSRRAVHMLTGACKDGLLQLSACPEDAVHVYSTVARLSGAFEGEIPWCPHCLLESTKQVTR